MVRLNKEYKVDVCDGINVKYGTVNKLNPNVIYIKCRMWIKPICKDDYQLIIDRSHSLFKRLIRSTILNGDIFNVRHILSFDIKPDNFIHKKSTFCSMSLYLKQKLDVPINAKELRGVISSDFGKVIREFESYLNNNGLLVRKKKW